MQTKTLNLLLFCLLALFSRVTVIYRLESKQIQFQESSFFLFSISSMCSKAITCLVMAMSKNGRKFKCKAFLVINICCAKQIAFPSAIIRIDFPRFFRFAFARFSFEASQENPPLNYDLCSWNLYHHSSTQHTQAIFYLYLSTVAADMSVATKCGNRRKKINKNTYSQSTVPHSMI